MRLSRFTFCAALCVVFIARQVNAQMESAAEENRTQFSSEASNPNVGEADGGEAGGSEPQGSQQGEAAGEEAVDDEAAAAVIALAKQLDSPVFANRQKAAAEILKLDAAAVGILESCQDHVSPACSAQLQVLIPRLRKRLFNDRLAAFQAAPSVANAAELPDWNRLSKIAGSGENVLQVFRELLLAEQDLFAARKFRAADFSEQLELRSAAFSALCDGRQEEDFPVVECAALMLVASDPQIRLTGRTSTNISSAMDDPRLDALMTNSAHADILQSVISAWIVRTDIAVDRPLLFAMRHQLPAGRTVALQTLKRARQNQSTYYSLLCLGVLNCVDDLPVVETLLNFDKKLWPPRGQIVSDLLPDRDVESTFSVQTRDVALAVALHLRNQNPADFGLAVTASNIHLFSIESMGFNTDDDRTAALEKYRTQFPARD